MLSLQSKCNKVLNKYDHRCLTYIRFTECEKWRKDFGGEGVEKLTQTFEYTEKKQIFEYYPQYYHKTDKVHHFPLPYIYSKTNRIQDGRPVYIEHLGKINLPAMQKITTDERMLENLVVEYEKLADPRLPACSRKSGTLLETCCTIMDAKGVSLTSAPSVYGYLGKASGISQNYYPERLGKLYVINAPWGFSTVFAVVKRFLDPVTVAKIHILGSGYKTELLSQIPAENLPASLGGKCECVGGCMFSDLGPWRDPEWARPPKWEKKDGEAAKTGEDIKTVEPVIEGTGTTPVVEGGAEAQKPL
jgi:hypothetical protein